MRGYKTKVTPWPITFLLVLAFLPRPGFGESLYSAGKKGLEAYTKGNYKDACDYYTKAQLEAPDKPEVFYNLGNAQYKNGDFDAALKNYAQALKTKNPDLKAKTHYNMGNAHFRKNDYDASIRDYEEALKINPKDRDALKNIDFVKKVKEQQQNRKNDSKDNKNKDKNPSDKNKGTDNGKKGDDKSKDGKNGDDRNNDKGKSENQPPKNDKNSGDDAKKDSTEIGRAHV
jgi:Ca-activated chloride channel family protein